MAKGTLCGLNLRLLAIALVGAVLIFPSALAAPHTTGSSGKCSPVCRRSHDTKLKYEADKSYMYDFSTESITELIGSSDEQSKLQVKGQAVISAQSACDFLLTVQKVSIQTGSEQAVGHLQELEGSSVRFALQDGSIEGLCVDEQDPTWSANIKRALVSMLQNKALKNAEQSIIHETDISGSCPTQYVVSGNSYTKTRDLNSCNNREGGNVLFHGVPYEVQSKHNSMPGVNSSMTCTQTVQEGIFKRVVCEEHHQLAAFSREESGARTTIKTTLTHKSTQNGIESSRSASASSHSSILFDHAETQEAIRKKTASQRTVEILNKICPEIENGIVSAKVAGHFMQLKKHLKFASGAELKDIHSQIQGAQLCPKGSKKLDKLFLDAAAMAASDGSIAFLADVYQAKKLEYETKSHFYLYTSFASRPGPKALAAIGKLLQSNEHPSTSLLLTASGLAHQYCKMTNRKCGEEISYQEVANEIAKIASNNCMSQSESHVERAVAALQALGNLDVLPNEAVAAITKCMGGNERIQIRALDAFRRQPCHTELKKEAQAILANRKKSSEIRIQAYLASTKCMQSEDLQVLQEIINKEKSHQVSSFIASHIQNRLGNSGPVKYVEQNALLSQLQLPSNIPQDVLKYSRNLEYSFFNKGVNMGGDLEGNLIFSQHSYVPSMMSGNVTVHAFGRSYNLFELGFYLDNFEHVLEKYFGPSSKIRTSGLKDIIKSGQEQLNEFGHKLSSKINKHRSKRSHKNKNGDYQSLDDNEIEAYQNEVEIENRYGQNGVGDVYVRVMGTSVIVDSFSQNQLKEYSLSNSILDGIDKFMEGAKDHKVDLTQPIQFIEDEMVVPTISGFPLNLMIEGTTVLSLQLNGQLDFGKLFLKNEEGSDDLKVRIVPSAATQLKGRMSMGSGPVETGFQVEGNLQSSSGVDVVMQNEPGKFDLKVNLPFEKIQLIDARTDLYWVEEMGDHLVKKNPVSTKAQPKEYGGGIDGLNIEALGLQLSAKVNIPVGTSKSPFFPLTGPSIISIGIEKSDNSMQGYHVQVLSNLQGEDKSFSVLLDTPGSKIDRKIAVNGDYKSVPNTRVELSVESPWKKFKTMYQLQNTKKVKGVEVAYSSAGEEYDAKAEIKRTGDSNNYAYEPLIQYSSSAGGVQKLVEGSMGVKSEGKSLFVDLKTNIGPMDIFAGTIKADIEGDSEKSEAYAYKIKTMEVDYPEWGVGKLGLVGDMKYAKPTYDLKVVATYGQSAHTLAIDSSFTRQPRERFAFTTNISSTRNEDANIQINYEALVHKSNNALEHTLQFVQGVQGRQLKINQHSLYDTQSSKKYEISNVLNVTRDASEIDFVLKFDLKKKIEGTHLFDFVVKNGDSHKAALNIKSGADVFFDYNLKANLVYPSQSYQVIEVAKKISDDTWRYDSSFIPTPGNKYEAITLLRLKNERNDMENSLETTVTSPALSQPFVFKSGVIKKSSSSAAYIMSKSQGEKMVEIVTEYKHYGGKPHAVNIKTFIANYVDATLNETHTRSSSNLNVNFDWKPTDRKIVVDSVLQLKGEQLSLDGQLKWDAAKDESKVAKIKSVTNFGAGWSMDSTNDVTYKGETRNVQLKGKLAKDVLNGEHFIDLKYRNVENKVMAFYLKNAMESTTRTKLSKLNAKVQLLDSQPAEMEWENRVANIDTKQLTFEILSDLNLKYGAQENLKLHGEVNSKIGNRRQFTGAFELSGSAMANPLSLDYNTELKQGAFKTSINSKFGTKPFNMDLGLKFDKWSPKKTADLTYKVNLPIHPRALEGSVRYTYIFDSWRAFEITETGSVSVNHGVATTWNNLLKAQDNEFLAQSQIQDQGHPLINLGFIGRKDKRRLVVDLQAIVKGHGAKFYTNVEGKFPYYNLRANGTIDPKDSSKKYDFKLYHRSASDDQSIETDLNVNSNGEHFTLTNKLENFPKRKSVDLLFTDGQTPRKVYLLLTNQEPKWNLDTFLKWGEGGKMLKSKGGLEMGNDVFDAVASFDSPALNIDKWSGRISRKLSNGRNSLAMNLEGREEKLASVGIDYAKKKERSGNTYDGSVKIDAKAARFHGSFRVENGVLEKKRDGEEGRLLRATVRLDDAEYPLNLTLLTRYTDVQKQVTLSFCNKDDQDCKIGNIQFRQEHNGSNGSRSYHSNGDTDYTLKATRQAISSGQRSTDGVVIRFSKAANGKDLEHTAELIINEEKTSQLGYRVYRKAGKEVGVELSLPERIMSAIATATRKPGKDLAELNFWMNKRNPEDKLSVLFSLEDIPQAKDNSEGVKSSIIVKHPSLPQDLKLKSKLIHGGHENIWDFVAEVDVFKHNGPLVLASKVQRQSVHDGHVYRVLASSKSQNAALNFGIDSEAKRTSKEVSLHTDVNYQNRASETKTSKIDFTYSEEHANFAITTGDSQPIISWSTSWNPQGQGSSSSSYDIRYEFLLPGMADARIFDCQLHPAIPPHANIKMYTAKASSGNFYQTFIGFRSNKQFTVGLYRQENQERRVIGDLNLALNSSRLLFVKADWDTKNIQSALEDAQERLSQTGNKFKSIVSQNLNETTLEVQYILSTFGNTLPNLQPIVQSYKEEVQRIRDELKTNEDTTAIYNYIEATEKFMEQYIGWVSLAFESISDAFAFTLKNLNELLSSIPQGLQKAKDKLPSQVQNLISNINKSTDAIIVFLNGSLEKAQELFQRISHISNDYVNWEFLNETGSGAGLYLQEALNYGMVKFVVVFEFVKETGAELMESKYVQSLAKRAMKRYQYVLSHLVDELKARADGLRESMLTAFPQKETQDFVLAVFQYAEKKATRVPVNDTMEQNAIYKKLVKAVQKAGSEIWSVDWENGLIVLQLPLPKPIDSLSDFNRLFLIDFPSWNLHLRRPAVANYGLGEFYNFVKAESPAEFLHRLMFSTNAIVPPMPAYALLVGSQYIRTFDGKFYHFEGNCQYLLASDFVDKNFTLAIQYEGDGPKIKKSILINYQGDSAVILPEFDTQVKHARTHADFGDELEVDETADGSVTVRAKNGALDVTCSKKHDVCMFVINGFYHGKTMGLLGTNNHEEFDDFSGPKGNLIEKSDDFVASWKLDRQCNEKAIPPHPAHAQRDAQVQCASAFQGRSSSLVPCFGIVNPVQYQNMCESLSSEKSYNNQKAVCSAAAAYVESCARQLIRIDLPSEC